MTSDFYSILGVAPTAEDVVIRAAYRALMRHYHPDTNSNPEAQEKARAITAAFAVLRDPARRAEYDSQRSGPVLWAEEEIRIPPDRPRPRPPAMRGLGIASAALALTLVVAAWALPQPSPPGGHMAIAPPARHSAAAKAEPPVELESESARLAKLRGEAPPEPPVVTLPVDQTMAAEALLTPPMAVPAARAPTLRLPVIPQRPAPAPARPIAMSAVVPHGPKVVEAPSEASTGCRPGGLTAVSVGCRNERLATLDRMAAGFFSQSMTHADAAKKQLLMSSHTRSAATRSACRSDSCVGDAYLRQMREISAIMEGRAVPAQ